MPTSAQKSMGEYRDRIGNELIGFSIITLNINKELMIIKLCQHLLRPR